MSEITQLFVSSSLYLRPNVNLSMREFTQLEEIQIDISATSNSGEICLDDIYSIIINFSTSNSTLDVHRRASAFVSNLFESHPENPKISKLSRFVPNHSLLSALSKLNLGWLPLTYTSLYPLDFDLHISPKFKELRLELNKNCYLYFFPRLPSPLKELSLRCLRIESGNQIIYIGRCKALERL